MQPLHVACSNGHKETAKLLLSYGGDANAVAAAGFTPLHMAANGSTDCPELCDGHHCI
jgi:ankyrin repeat protein